MKPIVCRWALQGPRGVLVRSVNGARRGKVPEHHHLTYYYDLLLLDDDSEPREISDFEMDRINAQHGVNYGLTHLYPPDLYARNGRALAVGRGWLAANGFAPEVTAVEMEMLLEKP